MDVKRLTRVRELPHDDDAEKMLLGNCLFAGSAEPLRELDPAVFYSRNNQLIAAEIQALSDAGEPVTEVRLLRRLETRSVSASYVATLTDGMPHLRDLTFYRQQIIETAKYRQCAIEAEALCNAYLTGNSEQIAEALQVFDAKRRGNGRSGFGVRAISVKEFLATEMHPRGMLLDPIIPEQGLAMIYSRRGVGKTHIALAIAAAVASGTRFLEWNAPNPQPVLYIDGELPASLLQKWIAEIVASIDAEAVGENLLVITPDLQERGIPDLSTQKGQLAIEQHVEMASLIILDNLSALCRTGVENEAEGWLPVQEWALKLRQRRKSVLFIHHAGHQGRNQRGTSKREDLLDTVIALRHPADYNPGQGLRAEIHIEKARHFCGEAAKSLTVQLIANKFGAAEWVARSLDETQSEKALRMFSEGMGVEGVMKELDVSRATAFRYQKSFRESQVSTPIRRDSETGSEAINDG